MSRSRATGPEPITNRQASPGNKTEPQDTMHALHPSQAQASAAMNRPPFPHSRRYKFAMDLLKRLHPYHSRPDRQHLNQGDFGVNWGQLDLSIAPPAHGASTTQSAQGLETTQPTHGVSFLRPLSSQDRQQLAQSVSHMQVEGLPSPEPPEDEEYFYDSERVYELFESCMVVFTDTRPKMHFVERTPWEMHELTDSEYPLLSKLDGFWTQWHVGCLLRPRQAGMPHTNCFILHGYRMDENSLLFSELWCILMLNALAIRDPGLIQHEIIPVTVISMASRDVRIVQGYVRGNDAPQLIINKSRIMDFNKGPRIHDIRNELFTVLSWALGTPIMPTQATA